MGTIKNNYTIVIPIVLIVLLDIVSNSYGYSY